MGAVERGSAAGNDAMDVRMMLQGLAPGVENHGHAELGAEMLGSAAMVASVSASARNRIA